MTSRSSRLQEDEKTMETDVQTLAEQKEKIVSLKKLGLEMEEKSKLMELCLDQRGSPSNRQNCRLTNVRERAATKICPEDNTTGKQKHDETVDV